MNTIWIYIKIPDEIGKNYINPDCGQYLSFMDVNADEVGL